MHQPIIDLPRLLADFLPQLGLGIKGFMFWQYRSETLGLEAPAWGLVRPDGTPRPVTEAASQFWDTLRPHVEALREAVPPPAEIGVWRSRRNEIFHFCTQGTLNAFGAAIDAYISALYWDNLPCRIISGEMLAADALEGLRLLIMPNGYYLTEPEATTLDRWVRGGGVLICEAHLGGYNGTTGRHSGALPGCGLASAWGLREVETTSPFHLRLADGQALDTAAMSEDARKALKDFGTTGGRYFPLRLRAGSVAWGAHRYAELAGEALEPLGAFDGAAAPCLARKAVGNGAVFYCGTNLGQAVEKDSSALTTILKQAVAAARITAVAGLQPEWPGTVHLDLLGNAGTPRFAVLVSRADRPQAVTLTGRGAWRGLFTGTAWMLAGTTQVAVPPGFIDLFLIETRG